MRLGEVLVMVPLDAAPPPMAEGVVFQADRGGRKGQYLVVTTRAAKPASAPGGGRASEYRLLSPETAGTLPDVDVLGIHYIKVRPERADAFEQFVGRTLHPAVANLRPDLRLLYYKAVAGHDAGNYIALFALTRESRDKYLAWRIRFRRFAGGVQAGAAAYHGAEHLPRGGIRPDGSQVRRRGVRKPDMDGLRARRAEVARTRRPVLSWRPMSIVRRRLPNHCAEGPMKTFAGARRACTGTWGAGFSWDGTRVFHSSSRRVTDL